MFVMLNISVNLNRKILNFEYMAACLVLTNIVSQMIVVEITKKRHVFTGPSYAIDSGSSGSLLAFEHGYRMLKTGMVDGVVVAGCSLLLNPVLSVMMQKMDIVSPEGICKPFDASGMINTIVDLIIINCFMPTFIEFGYQI